MWNNGKNVIKKVEGFMVECVQENTTFSINLPILTTSVPGHYKVTYQFKVERVPDPLKHDMFPEVK